MSYLQQLKQWLIKWFLILYALLWKLKLKYGKVSKIKDKILFPLNKPVNPIFPTFTESAGSEILNRMKLTLDNGKGDYDCLIHGSFSLEGKTSSCGQKSKSLASLIKDSRLCAAAFWRHGLRKGDIVHFVIPNNTEYHNLALGVWTCEGTLSLGDPDLSVSVLKTQLKASQLFS